MSQSELLAQPCSITTPTFTANLTGSPDSIWTSTSISRDGLCCGASNPDNCIEFILILDSLSSGIKLDIISGALPGGALFYQIGCGTSYQVGQEICLSGMGPHRITFCKPGGNTNIYRIKAIPRPNLKGKLVINQACIGFLKTEGLTPSSITWQSVPNNPTYNSYLSDTSGVDSVSITPSGNYPPQVTYRVCGLITGGCGSTTFCDTATIRFVSDIAVDILPDDPTICFGGTVASITANPVGGLAPFTYLWNTGAITQSINVGVGTYYVSMLDSLACKTVTDTVTVTSFASPIDINAGNDTSMCSASAFITLHGIVQAASGGKWTGGSGTYLPSDTSLTVKYYPTAAEKLSGSVMLKLTSTGNGSCPADSDNITITIHPTPLPFIIGSIEACRYKPAIYKVNKTIGNTYLWNITGGTILGANNDTFVTVIFNIPGVGTLTLKETSGSGCDSTATKIVDINPSPIPIINGLTSVCEYKSSTYTTNKSGSNSYLWNAIGGIIQGANNDTFVTVIWGNNGTGNISVKQTNTFTCDSTVSKNVTINLTPVPIINGLSSVCEYKTSTYTTNKNGSNSYLWNVVGGIIQGANNDTFVTVIWGNTGVGNISVKQTNAFTCDSTVSKSITINPTPVPIINGLPSVCEYKTSTYTTNKSGTNSYLWNVVGGTIQGASNDTFVTVIWVNNGAGSVSVKQTNSFTCDSTVSKNITINPTPVPVINGPSSVCEYKTSTYTTNKSGTNSYLWNVVGGTIQGASNDTFVTVIWGNTGVGSVSVKQTNAFTCDSTVSKSITINPTPAPIINGPSSVCEYKNSTYTTNKSVGNSYLWNVVGGTIQGTNNDTFVTVILGNNGVGNVSVKQTNTFTCDSTVSKNITINPTPVPVINGPSNICEYKTSTYTTNKNIGNSYLWNVVGGTIQSANNDTFVTIVWGNTGVGNISVKQTNAFTCDSTVSKSITINPTPVPIINGLSSVCEYKTFTYTTNKTVGNSYLWNVVGGTIQAVNNDTFVSVIWGNNGVGNISVKQLNAFTCDSTVSKSITINPTPAPIINGPSSVCEYKNSTYTTNKTVGNSHLWNVVGGTIQGINNDTFVTIVWGNASVGIVSVKQTNSFTCDSTVSKNITTNPTPVPIITGLSSVCEHKTSTYTTNKNIGNSYLWNVVGGIIQGANNDTFVTVIWGNNGVGNVSVKQTNAFTCDSTVSKNITIDLIPTPIINGASSVCEHKTSTYTTNKSIGNSYLWNVVGGTIQGTSNDTFVTVIWGNNGVGNISVKQTNSFTCDSTISKNITINPTPGPIINGFLSVCEYKTSTYTTNKTIGNSYLWNVVGGTIQGANNDTFVTVIWGNTGIGNVSVKQTNAFTCDSTVSKNITINPTPVPIINGASSVCEHKTSTYTTNKSIGNSYLWNVVGGTIQGANNDTFVTVIWEIRVLEMFLLNKQMLSLATQLFQRTLP
jgi:hypothetical protein